MAQHDPAVADRAPSGDILTPYDNGHLKTYLRLLDADAVGADWKDVARIVLGMDPEREPERARTAWESHLARAISRQRDGPDTRLPHPACPGRHAPFRRDGYSLSTAPSD
jgi:hypothetical protein